GRVIIQVPAFMWLYGTLDKADLHFRRYSKSEIVNKVKKAGFKIHKSFYFNFPGIIGWYLSGKVFKDKHFKSGRGKLFNTVIPVIKFVERAVRPPLGLSVFVIAEKM
ncbi:MAG: methyltransferase type 12, partial [Armatimonadota bacterium]